MKHNLRRDQFRVVSVKSQSRDVTAIFCISPRHVTEIMMNRRLGRTVGQLATTSRVPYEIPSLLNNHAVLINESTVGNFHAPVDNTSINRITQRQ